MLPILAAPDTCGGALRLRPPAPGPHHPRRVRPGRLTAADYEDKVAADPRIDVLRAKIACVEDADFTRDYHDPDKRSIANALTVTLKEGTVLPEVVVEYPIGHKRRRTDGMPLLGAVARKPGPIA